MKEMTSRLGRASPDKFWIIISDNDKDVKYSDRHSAEEALIDLGGGGYIMKATAYVKLPEVIDIR